VETQRKAETQMGAETHPFPLPPSSGTRPQLAIKPHRAMLNEFPKTVANYEEVRVSGTSRLTDLPLVAFTLLGQTAAGIAVISLLTGPLSRGVLSVIGGLVVAAALLSLLHLGTTRNAWRTPSNVTRSALSREVLALLLFGGVWLLAWLAPGVARIPLALAGVGLVYAMAEVYRIDGVPGWKTSRTRGAFAASALLLGGLTIWAASRLAQPWVVVLAGAVLVHQAMARWRFYEVSHRKTM
jgi:DMSO reductase anchor subunit